MDVKLLKDGKSLDAALVGEKALSVLSPERLQVLKALAIEPMYPAELARQLKMQVQTLYYHIKLLRQAGLIEMQGYEEQGGALAKRYKSTADALAVAVRPDNWKPYSFAKSSKPPSFFDGFIKNGFLNAKIVIGSPEPHGKFRAGATEFSSMELTMLLGSYASFEHPLYYLDTELREKEKRQNLIVIGGLKVNMLLNEINPYLPVYFEEKTFSLRSKLSNKTYSENCGVVETIVNPFNKEKKILVVAGLHHEGTRVAVLALSKERHKMEKPNNLDAGTHAKVVQGFDEDGDGIVDAVEILE